VGADTETVVLMGELDFTSTFDVELRLEQAIKRADRVVVDLRPLTFLDSTGLRALLEARRQARRAGVTFELIPGPPAVQQVFQVTGLLDEFPFTAG
jgi:anti-sigma B factor antagonist